MDIKGALSGLGIALAVVTAAVATGTIAYAQDPAAAEAAPVARAVAVSASMDQDTYLATMRALLAGKPGDAQSDATLVESGESICADIDGGATRSTFEQQIRDYDLDRAVYRVIIRSAILTFCPEDSAQILR